MKKSYRYITSLLLTMIYLLIVFSPLAPFAMQSKLVAHAVTGECTGDCRIDGCSLERSAAHTCCCWQNKLHLDNETHRHSSSDCGSTQSAAPMAEAPKHGTSSCTLHIHGAHENSVESESVSNPASQEQRTTTVSSTTCGSGKLFDLLNVETTHHLPFIFTGDIHSPAQSDLVFNPPDHLASRYCDPPDPPPINMIIS